MSVWFEGEGGIDCSLEQVEHAVGNPGEFFMGVVRLMPGLADVELVDEQAGSVTIKTNEGLMKRTNVATQKDSDRVVIEFDEEYAAGSRVTTNAHFRQHFASTDHGVTHQLTISDLTAPGILGFFYRRFGASKMGKASLTAHKTSLERPNH
ncbi:MAG: hypothetical protein OES13_02820 [Acidimicrobiia bacterium]|nr:hypothetical protein [Acidimicrobiia bacterium]